MLYIKKQTTRASSLKGELIESSPLSLKITLYEAVT